MECGVDGPTKLLLRGADLQLLLFSSGFEKFFRIEWRREAVNAHPAAGHGKQHLHLEPVATAKVTMSQLNCHVAANNPFMERAQFGGLFPHPLFGCRRNLNVTIGDLDWKVHVYVPPTDLHARIGPLPTVFPPLITSTLQSN